MRPRVWLLVLALAIFGVLMIFPILPAAAAQMVSYIVRAVTVLAAGIAMALRARQGRGTLRVARALIAAALLFGAFTGILGAVIAAVTGTPTPVPSVFDAAYLVVLPLFVIGMLLYPVSDNQGWSWGRNLLDGALAATALWLVLYFVLLESAGATASLPMLAQLTILAYPAADAFGIAMIAGVIMRVHPLARRELLFIAGGFLLLALQDIAYSTFSAMGKYQANSWVAVVAEVGFALILIGALSPTQVSTAGLSAFATKRNLGTFVVILPFVPVVLVVLLAPLRALRGQSATAIEYAAIVVLIALMLLRYLIGSHDQKLLLQHLRSREQLFRSLVTGSSDLITLHDAQGRVQYASPAVFRTLGISETELIGCRLDRLIHPEDTQDLIDVMTQMVAENQTRAEVVFRGRDKNGDWRWAQSAIHNLLDDPSVRGVVCNTRDIHEEHLLREQLVHDAYHDALTGLGNLAQARATFAGRCYGEQGRPATLLLADIDSFKTINDTYGHAFGDAMLIAIGKRLGTVVHAESVARLGGDEFIWMVDADQDAAASASEVLQAFHHPIVIDRVTVNIEMSVGIARSSDASDASDLLRNADLAMYAAKEAGRNQFVCYESWMLEHIAQRQHLQDGLRLALDKGYLSLVYQPLVKIPDGSIVGAEALCRWDDPVWGRISPELFIPAAELTGIIADIDNWVFNEACRQLAQWRDSGLRTPRVSINVSRRQITFALPAQIRNALAEYGLQGRQLCVEVTESAVVPDLDVAVAVLVELRMMGITVALDDFGTGQSSLSHLAKLPVDIIKIDRSFVMTSASDDDALRLLTSIAGVCRALSLPMLAEGIEDSQTVQNLAAIGCQFGQGYYFARPMSAQAFGELLPQFGSEQVQSEPLRLPSQRPRSGIRSAAASDS